MAHTELDLRERRLIADLPVAKVSVACIARPLSRHRSTVYREIRRNSFEDVELPEFDGDYGVRARGRPPSDAGDGASSSGGRIFSLLSSTG